MTEDSPVSKFVVGLFSLYMMTVMCAGVYYNWQFARTNGLLKWVLFGEIVSTAKSLIWPYFAFVAPSTVPGTAILVRIGTFALWAGGLGLFSFVLTCLAALISKYRRVTVVFAFCVGAISSYSTSFAFDMIALAIQATIPPKNIAWPLFTWLAVSLICLWQSLSCVVSARPAFWAYCINGTIAVLPLFFAGHAFITLFTALPLFAIAVLLRSRIFSSDAVTQLVTRL
jgi:hypothetical protein